MSLLHSPRRMRNQAAAETAAAPTVATAAENETLCAIMQKLAQLREKAGAGERNFPSTGKGFLPIGGEADTYIRRVVNKFVFRSASKPTGG